VPVDGRDSVCYTAGRAGRAISLRRRFLDHRCPPGYWRVKHDGHTRLPFPNQSITVLFPRGTSFGQVSLRRERWCGIRVFHRPDDRGTHRNGRLALRGGRRLRSDGNRNRCQRKVSVRRLFRRLLSQRAAGGLWVPERLLNRPVDWRSDGDRARPAKPPTAVDANLSPRWGRNAGEPSKRSHLPRQLTGRQRLQH